jgi:hypothetical protein
MKKQTGKLEGKEAEAMGEHTNVRGDGGKDRGRKEVLDI